MKKTGKIKIKMGLILSVLFIFLSGCSAVTPTATIVATPQPITLSTPIRGTSTPTALPATPTALTSGEIKQTAIAQNDSYEATMRAQPTVTVLNTYTPEPVPTLDISGGVGHCQSTHDFGVYNCWNGLLDNHYFQVSTGILEYTKSGKVGVVDVITSTVGMSDDVAHDYQPPENHGGLFITSVEGSRLNLLALDGYAESFDLLTHTWKQAGSCEVYPIAFKASLFANAKLVDVFPNIQNSKQTGNFGWVSWTGDNNTSLATSIIPPGNSSTYTNPLDQTDHKLTTGKWVYGRPGVDNSKDVRDALDKLLPNHFKLVVPLWDQTTGNGNNLRYHISGFAWILLITDDLQEQQIHLTYFGPATCK